MDKLLHFIGSSISMEAALIEELQGAFSRKEVQKGDILLKEGGSARYLYFVESGILHNFYYHDGRKVTSWFYSENHFITAWTSFLRNKPSYEYIECLENCILYQISYENYQKLIAEFPSFNNFARILTEDMLLFIDQLLKSWSFLTAKEKYDLIKVHFPDIEQRVQLGLVASFLGISQETLSRIRSSQ